MDQTAQKARIDGVVIGVLMGFSADGAPLVVYPGNPAETAAPARTTAVLAPDDVGCEVALLFEEIRKRGVSILLVEQKLAIALDISERLYVMGHGRIVFEGTARDVRENAAMRKEWLEV